MPCLLLVKCISNYTSASYKLSLSDCLFHAITVVPFVNNLCLPNFFTFPKCTVPFAPKLYEVASTKYMVKIFYLLSFIDFKLNDGLQVSGSPNANQNPNLTIPVVSLLPCLYPDLTHYTVVAL